MARKPKNLSFEQASALSFGGMTMLSSSDAPRWLVRRRLEVAGVCSTANVELVAGIGAHHVMAGPSTSRPADLRQVAAIAAEGRSNR